MKREKRYYLKDILGWDVISWSPVIKHWDHQFNEQKAYGNKKGLELGAGFYGGLTLYLALKGIHVDCSSYHPQYIGATREGKNIHKAYKVEELITYKEVNATFIDSSHNNEYDFIVFKSMLGGIVKNNDLSIAKRVLDQVYQALKPGGKLIFAENLSSTFLHTTLRKSFGSGKNDWRYFTIEEILLLLTDFNMISYETFGFLGCLGFNEQTRKLLGHIDNTILIRTIPPTSRYIFSGIVEKPLT